MVDHGGPVSVLFPFLECHLDINSTVQQAQLCYKPAHMVSEYTLRDHLQVS